MLRLIKAVVRLELLEEVLVALKMAGVPRLTVSHVRAVGSGADPKQIKLSLELGTGFTEKALVEFVCSDDQADSLVKVICEHARTGCHGDGVVFVSSVDQAVKVRSGVQDLEAIA